MSDLIVGRAHPLVPCERTTFHSIHRTVVNGEPRDVVAAVGVAVDDFALTQEQVAAALKAGFVNALAQISLIGGDLDELGQENLDKQKSHTVRQLEQVFNTAANTANITTLDGFLRTFENYVESVRVVARRFTNVRQEQERVGDALLPVGLEVEVAKLRKMGRIVAITEGFGGRPYYEIHLRNKYGQYDEHCDPQDDVFCYSRDLVFDKAALIRGNSATLLIVDDPQGENNG